MKFKIPVLCLVAFMASCANSSPSSSFGTLESETLDSSLEISQTETSSSSFAGEIGTVYRASSWDESIEYFLEWAAPGSSPYLVDPGYSTYEVLGDVLVQEGQNDLPYVQIEAFPAIPDCASSYLNALSGSGMTLSSSAPYAYAKLDATRDLIVEASESTKEGSRSLLLRVYALNSRTLEAPKELVDIVTGLDLPLIEAESYEAFFNGMNHSAGVYAYGVGESDFLAYEPLLLQNGFAKSASEPYMRSYSHVGGYVRLTVLLSSDAYGEPCLYFQFLNAYPRAYVLSLLGRDVPLLPLSPLTFDYSFVGESDILTLYYDEASQEDYQTYQGLLIEGGFLETENSSYHSDALGTDIYVSAYSYQNKSIQVLYNPLSGTIAIPILG